jgi:8-amino-7-oxononanoate synthase
VDRIEKFLNDKLQQRKEDLTIRNLSTSFPSVDFCSNEYLGLAKSSQLKSSVEKALNNLPEYRNGSGGSRLLSGNNTYIEETEQFIADFHLAESGLILTLVMMQMLASSPAFLSVEIPLLLMN